MATFNTNNYKDIFEKRFGSGSYESGLSSAREIGRMTAQAEIAKSEYEARRKAAEKAAKEAAKAAEKAAKNKSYDDAVGTFGTSTGMSETLSAIVKNPKKEGAYRNAEKIKNDPSLQAEIKANGWTVNEFIDAMYNAASGGKFKSARDFNSFNTQLKKDTKAANKKRDDEYEAKYGMSYQEKYDYDQELKKLQEENKKKKKDDDGVFSKVNGFFGKLNDELKDSADDITTPAKNWLKAINPFDDVSYKEAFKKNVDDALSSERSKTTKEVTRGLTRIANTGTLGLLDQAFKATNNGKQASQFTNENRGTAGKVADFGYDMAGYLLPGLGAANALRTPALSKLKLGADLSKTGAGKAVQLGKEGFVTGAALGAAEVGIREGLNPNDYSARENLTHFGLSAGLGAVGDPALYGAGRLANRGLEAGLRRMIPGDLPKFSGNVSDDVINRLPTSRMPEPISQPSFRNVTPSPADVPSARMNRANMDSSANFQTEQINPLPNQQNPLSRLSTQQDSLQNTVQPLRAGRDFEPIEQVAAAREPEPFRVADELLDEQRQAQGNADTFRGKVDRNPKKENNLFRGLRTQFIDDLAPLENLEKQITGKVSSAEDSVYKQGRLFRGSAEKAHQTVQEELGPILNAAQKNGISMEDLGDYALAVHARDVNAKGINSGFTNAEIEDVINNLGTPEMEALRRELLNVNNKMLDYLSTGEAPVLSTESVQAMREQWPNYMSLARSFDDEKVEFASGMSNALSVGSSPIQRLKGSNRDAVDPLESMVRNVMQSVNVADRNKVASQLGKLADHENAAGIVNRLPKNAEVGRKNVISVMDKGEKVYYEVPPEVYKSMKDLDKESTLTIVKMLQTPASWLRAGATLTPEFSLRNPMRDVPQAFIVSESGFNPVTDFAVGLWDTIWKGRTVKIGNKTFKPSSGELYKQFIKENGGFGNIISMDRDLHKNVLEKTLTDGDPNYINILDKEAFNKLINSLKHPLETTKGALQGIADISETGTKLGEFRAALRKGETPQEAAYRARDIMDFSRAGVSVRQANRIVAFMNANIQGKSKLWRAFQNNPMKVTGKAIAAVTLPTIGAIMAQETMANDKQKEILEDAPQWLRDTNYLIPIPGTDQIARIPKPFDLAYPFSNSLERAVQFVKNNDEEAYNGFIKSAISSAAIPVMITGLTPILEGMGNYSAFRQGPIIPQREQGLEYPDQYDVNSSEIAKMTAKGIHSVTEGEGAFKNFGSPRIIDNTIQGFFGGLGTYATSAADGVIGLFADEERPERPAKNIDQKPLAKAFLVNQSSGGQSMDKLYSTKTKLSKEKGSAKQNQEPFTKEGQYKFLNNATERLSDINKQIRTIENSPDYTAEQKRSMINELTQQRNQLSREAMEIFKNME